MKPTRAQPPQFACPQAPRILTEHLDRAGIWLDQA
jgi:hypothetical protein